MNIITIAHLIEMAVAPVFLLTGISGLLGVLTNRLDRIIDRSRVLAKNKKTITCAANQALQGEEDNNLLRRSRLIHLAIASACTGALLVCAVIMIIFTGIFLQIGLSNFIAALFIICMIFLSMSLSFFLSEVFFATRVIELAWRKGEHLFVPSLSMAV